MPSGTQSKNKIALERTFKRLGGRRLFILAAALALFFASSVINKYIIGSTSSPFYSRLIQQDILQRERSFQRLASDTALLLSLINRTYSEQTLQRLSDRDKNIFFFIYDRDSVGEHKLLFWNTQQAVPPINIMNETDASRMVRLSNGLYVHTSKSLYLPGNRRVSIEGLLPVMWKYFVEIENLQKEFVAFPDAGKRVDITFKPSEYPVRSSYGNILFYLEKTTILQKQTGWWSIIISLMGVFFLIIYVHQCAQYIALRYGLLAGTAVLLAIILLMRFASYEFPDFLELRQFELFDPAIYSSSFVFSSLGDLMINGILFCWLTLFVSRRLPPNTYSPFRFPWLNMTIVVFSLAILVGFTFVFADILQSLVADAQISFLM